MNEQYKKQKEWREENKDKIAEYNKKDYVEHKEKRDKRTKNYRKKCPWIRFYTNAKQRCTNPKNPSYKYYGAKGAKFELTLEQVKELYLRDKAGKMERPSLDREVPNLGYTFSNCKFIELSANVKKHKYLDK